MKILFYCDEYPPARHGGIGSVLRIVAEALVKRGHEVYVVGSYAYGHQLSDFSVINGVKIYRLTHFYFYKFFPSISYRYLNFFLRNFNFLHTSAKKAINRTEDFIEKLIKIEEIDCIEVVDYTSLLACLRGTYTFKKYSIPTIMRVHGSLSFITINRGNKNSVWLRNDINNFSRADFISAVSAFSAEFTKVNLNIGNKKIDVIYNPIEAEFLLENSRIISSNKIVFIGKVTESKGAFSLLKAFNHIASLYPDLELIVIGGGEIEKAKTLIDPLIKDRVSLTGYINRNDLASYIDQSLFCVIPTYFESFGMVALEVMARGKALIYTARATGPEIITHGKDGLLVDPTDINDIAESMMFLLNNREKITDIGTEALARVKHNFTTDVITGQLEAYYLSVLSSLE